jgi:hypothetical protein
VLWIFFYSQIDNVAVATYTVVQIENLNSVEESKCALLDAKLPPTTLMDSDDDEFPSWAVK